MPTFRVAPVAASEGATSLTFTVALDEASTNEVRVTYSLDNATAFYNSSAPDFQTQSAVLIFTPGQTSKTITVALVNNTTAEPTEAFWLDLTSPVNATVAQRWTPAFIFDNDAVAGTPAIAVGDVQIDERNGTASFFVSLSRPSTGTVSVAYATGDDTARAGSDYAAAAGTLSFAPGEMVKTVVVDLIDDAVAEGEEFFRLQLSSPTGATLLEGFAVAEIGHSDASPVGAPMVTARAVAAGESDTALAYLVQLSAPSTNEVRINYAIDNGQAFYNSSAPDFQSYSGTLVFAPGETTKTLPVLIIDNTTIEGTEAFWLDLNTPVNATVPQRWTPAFLVDNDSVAGTPAISVGDVIVDEGARVASFFVSLSRPSTGNVSVNYATGDDTAQAGSDYRAASGSLVFAPGEVVKTVTVDISDDSIAEGEEFFRLGLSSPSGATLVEGFAIAEIGHSDGPPTGAPAVIARPLAAGEGDGSTAFLVQLTVPSVNEVRINYSLDNGQAFYNSSAPDFQSYSGTLVFAPGETTKTLPVLLTDNTTAESAEIFWLDLNTPVNATVPQRWTPAVLFDNDAVAGTPAIAVGDVVVDEGARTASFFVSLSRPSVGNVSVNYATADDTARAGSDYRAASGMLVFAPGEVAKTVVVDIVDDTAAETQEFFKLALSVPSGATLIEGFALAEIGHSDGAPVGAPSITSRPVAAGESDGWLSYVITLSAPSLNEVRVNYALDNGLAFYNSSAPDFQSYSGTLIFLPGETTKTLPVLLVDNTTAEGAEAFWLDLNTPVNATVEQRWTPAFIFDNDAVASTPAVSVGDVVVDESARTASFFVTLSRPSTVNVSVNYATADDTALAGSDYRAASGTLVFAPGEVAKTVLVDITDDALAENEELLQLLLSAPSGATLGDSIGGALIGVSDDRPVSRPAINARPAVAGEGDLFSPFIVQLSAASQNEVRVNYSVGNGTAFYNSSTPDFQTYSGTLVFAPGETIKLLPVMLINDTAAENDEVFTLDLNTAVNATVTQRFTNATVIDNDGSATVLSAGLGNDTYTLASVLDRIAEAPGGGTDTVRAGFSFTLPDNVENLVLTGSALNALGNGSNNILRGTAGNNLFDGKGGIDTVVFSGPSSAYALAGNVTSRSVTSAADGSDTLTSVERLQFTDIIRAEDTTPGGNTYLAYALLNAVLNRGPDTSELSYWVAQLDHVGSLRGTAQVLINTYAPGVSDELLVSYLWFTLVGSPIPIDALTLYTGLVGNGTFTQASLLETVTTLEINTLEIANIVGQPLTLDPSFFPAPG